jgi:uncharacterized membrane protein (UPF0182 family)
MERTLDAAHARLFGGSGAPPLARPPTTAVAAGQPAATAPPPITEGTRDLSQLAAEAQATYERAIAAQKAGDWARYGDEIRRLGDLLQRMKQP